MTCYFPNGLASPGDLPCVSDAQNSHCCRPNDICLDNGYCLGAYDNGPNVLTRSTCTDPTFGSKTCPQLCNDVNTIGAAVLHLYNFASPSTYCCGPYNTSSGRCNDKTFGSNLPFVLPNGNFVTNRITGTIWGLNLTQPSAADEGTTVTAECKTVTVEGKTATALATATATATATVTVVANASLNAMSSTTSNSNFAVGAGVGIPLGVLLLLAIGGLILLWRRHKHAERRWLQERQNVLESFAMADMKRPMDLYRNDNAIHELYASSISRMPELGEPERR